LVSSERLSSLNTLRMKSRSFTIKGWLTMEHACLSMETCACNVTLNQSLMIQTLDTSAILIAMSMNMISIAELAMQNAEHVTGQMSITVFRVMITTLICIGQDTDALRNAETDNRWATMSAMMATWSVVMDALIIARLNLDGIAVVEQTRLLMSVLRLVEIAGECFKLVTTVMLSVEMDVLQHV
jgi:hypothetical protein